MDKVKNSGLIRRRWLYGTVAALAGLGGAGLALRKFGLNEVDEAALTALWGMSFETPYGARLSLSTFRGRPLLVNFWATWCPPCVEELPLLEAFYQENKSNGWQVVGLAVDRLEPVQAFLARQSLGYPMALAGMAGISLSKSMGNVEGGLPFTVVLGGNGAMLGRKIGRISPQDLARWHGLK
jgi:thiol-disulfide isomerase/thioredoxin